VTFFLIHVISANQIVFDLTDMSVFRVILKRVDKFYFFLFLRGVSLRFDFFADFCFILTSVDEE
jgi:hypothetical protein